MARPRKRAANGSVRENGQALEVTITHDPASVQQSQSKPALETSYKQKYQWVSYNRTGFDGPKRMHLTDQRRAEIRKVREKGACSRCNKLRKRVSRLLPKTIE